PDCPDTSEAHPGHTAAGTALLLPGAVSAPGRAGRDHEAWPPGFPGWLAVRPGPPERDKSPLVVGTNRELHHRGAGRGRGRLGYRGKRPRLPSPRVPGTISRLPDAGPGPLLGPPDPARRPPDC